jgi:hypothetical protein
VSALSPQQLRALRAEVVSEDVWVSHDDTAWTDALTLVERGLATVVDVDNVDEIRLTPLGHVAARALLSKAEA